MAAARIAAALAVAFLSVKLVAQPTPQGRITIEVIDTTGAAIPGARIEVDPPTGAIQNFAKANSWGEVILNLTAGSHVLRISSSGFRESVTHVNAENNPDRMVKITLQVDTTGHAYSGPCWRFYDLEPWNRLESVQLPNAIPLRPMMSFAPLPARRIKSR
jgi:hypothetical protein